VFHRTDRADRRARDSSPRRPGGVGVGLHGVGSGTHGSNTSLLASVTKKLPSKSPEAVILLLLATNASDGSERTAFILAELSQLSVTAPATLIFTLAASRPPATYSLPLITPAAKRPTGCGKVCPISEDACDGVELSGVWLGAIDKAGVIPAYQVDLAVAGLQAAAIKLRILRGCSGGPSVGGYRTPR